MVDQSKFDYGIDLTKDQGWFLHVVGWRQLVLLLTMLIMYFVMGMWVGRNLGY